MFVTVAGLFRPCASWLRCPAEALRLGLTPTCRCTERIDAAKIRESGQTAPAESKVPWLRETYSKDRRPAAQNSASCRRLMTLFVDYQSLCNMLDHAAFGPRNYYNIAIVIRSAMHAQFSVENTARRQGSVASHRMQHITRTATHAQVTPAPPYLAGDPSTLFDSMSRWTVVNRNGQPLKADENPRLGED